MYADEIGVTNVGFYFLLFRNAEYLEFDLLDLLNNNEYMNYQIEYVHIIIKYCDIFH